ncbi:alanine racemase [Radiobacillus sp. PE A8.2]|uniref:alanine racemase n=1 Tax=Radiobacillus sp. PE A8.2 TaxID=3380349 RepID=UPI00388E4D14
MTEKTFYRDSWANIHLNHIAFNIQQLKQRLSPDTNIYAVVKANAYGHGDIEVAKTALEAGAPRLAVAILDEAIRLRDAGITVPILVMGWIRPEDVWIAAERDITVTFFQKQWLEQVKKMDFSKPLTLHMKWDTGMGRIGIREEAELIEVLHNLNDDRFKLEGIFTHFATADEAEIAYYKEQQTRFNQLFACFQAHWTKPVILHTGNSAASMRFPEEMKHFVRFGISMYGLYPSKVAKAEEPIKLKPAMSLHSRLIHVKKVPAQTAISYGATYKTDKEEWIGTVPLGYADGIIRKLQGMDVLVNGQRMPIVGRVCMDQFMVKLDQSYPIGTLVTIIGSQSGNAIEMDEIADYLDTISYEVACTISARVPRLYRE